MNGEIVRAVLEDWQTAPVDDKLRETLGFLEKLTRRPTEVGAADIDRLRRTGLNDAAIEDAIHICGVFNVIDRVADSLDFEVPSDESFARKAGFLLEHGYR